MYLCIHVASMGYPVGSPSKEIGELLLPIGLGGHAGVPDLVLPQSRGTISISARRIDRMCTGHNT